MRLSKAFLLCVVLALIMGVFMTSNRVQQAEKKMNSLQDKIEQEKENLRVLHAEWTYLNNPERLEKVAKQYFQLVPGGGEQYVAASEIPLRDVLDAQQQDVDQEAATLAQIEPGNPDSMLAQEEKKETAPAVDKTRVSAMLPAARALPPALPINQQVGAQ